MGHNWHLEAPKEHSMLKFLGIWLRLVFLMKAQSIGSFLGLVRSSILYSSLLLARVMNSL